MMPSPSPPSGRNRISLLVLVFITLVSSWATNTVGVALRTKFYSRTCPVAEAVIQSTVIAAFIKNPGIAPGLLRMHFHDCFVEGCDASVLIDGNDTEKNSPPNLRLRGFEVVDDAKARLEMLCPNVVSCADILAYAARDSVFLTGGPTWDVPAGRRDGTVSLRSEPVKFLPPPSANVSLNTRLFNQVSLSQDDMIILSGAHTIGIGHCGAFINRLYNFNSTFSVDPSLNPQFAQLLRRLCPQGNPNPNTEVNMDFQSPQTFDNAYYTNLEFGRGLFTSDQTLFTDPTTRNVVLALSRNNREFRSRFVQSMIKMSSINVKTGSQGQIRRNCRVVDSSQAHNKANTASDDHASF